VVYTGCVGDDGLKDQLSAVNAREGVLEVYDVRENKQTGACAVIITGHHRSMVTTLRAAREFNKGWLDKPRIATLIAGAKVFYAEGYFLTHGTESLLSLAERSAEAGKIFALNISAPYIPQLFKSELDKVIPLSNIIICNEAEARAWAFAAGISGSVLEIAHTLATLPKYSQLRPRVVIITQGPDATILACSDSERPKVYLVDAIPKELIVDTNGAGDAFAGGFLGAFVLGKSLDECVNTGHKMGAMCVQLTGAQFKWPKVRILN